MNKTSHLFYTVCLILSIALSGCSSQFGRYQQANDSTPTRLPSSTELRDAVPRVEQKSRGGNRDYTVRGKSYKVLNDAEGFTQTGIASWYGKKFHGHLTSNGEIYDMYAMSAAHKSLPLPTYLEVTNLDNGKHVIVRANDRGPFHQDRVIDLSYSAAYKLDMLKTGTANVRIVAITDPIAFSQNKNRKTKAASSAPTAPTAPNNTVNTTQSTKLTTSAQGNIYIQIFATKSKKVALDTAMILKKQYQHNVITPHHQGLFRVQLGPFKEQQNLTPIITTLQQSGYPNAYRRKILQ
ncbi:septal ring lytic transglycosylase RlpA family protein [Thalassotalea atypica]|uniref:septal ring lytic transglycosylase RlpA family protein n=1 Tax=Thalassotalea atypica TaxID=2054316 RepID=UPI0025731A8C|nr:septal ring lytic transglycosylase RlpA family protein [Thalassotalea atypica]